MENKNFVIITTYIGSGVTDKNFINQRMNILTLSTIPSIVNQTTKNFIWCIYLDELNNPKKELRQLIKMLKSYRNLIKIHICKYKPILSDGSLCVDNRARSCSAKRYELYIKSIDYCKKMGYLDNVEYISHLMLDDDDPIMKNHINWINKKVFHFHKNLKDSNGIIIINKNQYIFYLGHMALISIESCKSMKGSCFIFYPIESYNCIKFHPYSILETIDNNLIYKTKYNIEYQVVDDPPTWIYFRHQLSTSGYSKDFLINKKKLSWQGENEIIKKLDFYKNKKVSILSELFDKLKNENKSLDLVNWKNFRNTDKKKILFIIQDLDIYEIALELCVFIKNNFIVNLIGLDSAGKDCDFIKKHSRLFEKNSYFQTISCPKGVNKGIADEIMRIKPDHTFIFGNLKTLSRIKYFLRKNLYLYDIFDEQEENHVILGMDITNIKNWKTSNFLIIYNQMITTLLS